MTHHQKEELVNSITHAVGIFLSIIGLILLITLSSDQSVTGFVIFGGALIFLYLASTLYHCIQHTRIKTFLRKIDHMAIFILIAGTYTPFCLTALPGITGLILLFLTWSLCAIGIILKIFFTGKYEWLSLSIYALAGWMVIFFIMPVFEALPLHSFIFLLSGGLVYTIGIYFYVNEKIKYSHGIWHGFVMGGSLLHFISVITMPY